MKMSTSAGRKVYELRVYDVIPSKMADYAKLTGDLFHLRLAHSRLCGFWLTEMGGQNQAVHIWEYDSLMQRKSVRDALAADADWMQQYLSPARSMWQRQDNTLMLPVAPLPDVSGDAGWFYRLSIGGTPEQLPGTETCGEWLTALGGVEGQQVKLVRSKNMDELISTDASSSCSSRLLLPAPFLAKHKLQWS